MYSLNIFGNYSTEIERLEKLSKLGDPLERLHFIQWDMFTPVLKKVFAKEKKGPGGRPPYSYLLMFKILILQRMYNLSDDQIEYQISDRFTFMRFLNLSLSDKIPDAKTIWLFRETLTKAEAIKPLFQIFEQQMEKEGLITHNGTLVDATFVDVPKQHNSSDENKTIKEGHIPEDWTEDTPKARHKIAQKDVDARWAKKGAETHFGYKNHAKVDADSKLITDYVTTAASVHDSNVLIEFLTDKDRAIYADAAYYCKKNNTRLPAHIRNCMCIGGTKNRMLTAEQKAANKAHTRKRCRIEHVFGYMTNSMHGLTMRCIGIARATSSIGLTNLTYNLNRYCTIKRKMAVQG